VHSYSFQFESIRKYFSMNVGFLVEKFLSELDYRITIENVFNFNLSTKLKVNIVSKHVYIYKEKTKYSQSIYLIESRYCVKSCLHIQKKKTKYCQPFYLIESRYSVKTCQHIQNIVNLST